MNSASGEDIRLLFREEEEQSVLSAPITYRAAFRQLLALSAPLSLSESLMAVQGLANGRIVRHLSPHEIAAVLIAMQCVSEVLTFCEGTLKPIGVRVAQHHKAAAVEENQHDRTEEYARIGEVVAQGGWTSLGLSVPAILLLRTISGPLIAMGIPEEVADAVQAYCSAFSYGILPLFLWTTLQECARGTEQTSMTLVSKNVRAGLSMSLSYLLALGAWGAPRLGIAGLGYGTALSTWISLIGLGLYYRFSGRHHHFKLFNVYFPKLKDICSLLSVGVPRAFQEACEGAKDLILSLLAGKMGKQVSIAQEASSVPISVFETLLAGLVSASGTKVAGRLGELNRAIRQGDDASVACLQQNMRRFGHTGLVTGLAITLIAGLLMTGFAQSISEMFIDTSNEDIPKETLALAQKLFTIHSMGLIFETLKNISAEYLLSLGDTLFASLFSVLTSLVSLSAGAYLCLQADQGAAGLFIAQLLGSVVCALGITERWLKKSNARANVHRLV